MKIVCHSDCLTCSGTTNNDCTVCYDPYATAIPGDSCKCITNYKKYSSSPIECTYDNCNAVCDHCTGPESTDCIDCEDAHSSLDSTGTCVCDNGYYKKGTSKLDCTRCDSECSSCFGSDKTMCITCVDSNAIVSTTTSLCICSDGYFQSGTNPVACSLCDVSCATCSESLNNNCLTCKANASITALSTCVCNTGYLFNVNLCQACHLDCYDCTGFTKFDCISCSDSNASIVSSVCICNTGFYTESTNPLVCGACHADCYTCSGGSQLQCLLCKDSNANIVTNLCTCNTGFYSQSTNPLVCGVCHADCYECTGGNNLQCTACSDSNASIVSSMCTCNIGFYSQSTNPLVCGACHADCKTCSGGSQLQCLVCKDSNANIVSNLCTCKTGFYIQSTNPLVCGACHADCNGCTGGNNLQCTACSDSNASMASSMCTCTIGFYSQSTNPLVCANCHPDCKTCSGGSQLQCLVCKDSNANIVTNLCTCNTGFYSKSTDPLVCEVCHSDCSECTGGNNFECSVCADSNAGIVSSLCTCNNGFFIQATNPLECAACHADCSQCTGSTHLDCIVCRDSKAQLLLNQCTCISGYFKQSINPLFCAICHPDCIECNGSTDLDCISCKDTNSKLTSGKCTCKSGYFIESDNPLNCSLCHSECLNCTGSKNSDCTACSDPKSYLTENNTCECIEYFFKGISNQCIKCADGFYKFYNECLACNSTCTTCIAYTNCTTCIDLAMNLNSGSCECSKNFSHFNEEFKECECFNGYFRVNNQCELCEIGCAKCINNLNCTEQSSGYYIDNGIPKNCHKDCKECFGQNNNNCIECHKDKNLVNGYCNCSKGYYKDGLLCTKCMKNCIDCASFTDCQNCEENHTYDNKNLECTMDYNSIDITDSVISSITSSVGYFGVVASLVSATFSNHPSLVWTTINTVQLLCYIPLQNIEIPSKLYSFFKRLQPINLIPNIFKVFNILDCDSKNLNPKFVKYGYRCKYFITNTGEIIFAFGLSILYLILVYILYLVTCCKVKDFFAKQLKDYKWSYIVRFWIEGYLDLALPCIITLNTLGIDTPNNTVNSTLGFVFSFFVVFSSVICWIFILHANYSFNDEDYTLVEKYATIFREFKYKMGLKNLMFYPYFFLRRAFYVLILYNLFNYPEIQVAFNVTHSEITVFYIIKIKPFEKNKVNIINLVQELLVSITFGLCGLFILNLEAQMKNILEISIIVIVSVVIIISYVYAFVELIIQLKNYLKKRNSKFKINVSNTVNNDFKSIKVKKEIEEIKSDNYPMNPRNSRDSPNNSLEIHLEKLSLKEFLKRTE